MAAKLKMAGVESFHLYEQWDDLGGTWHANTYPGLHCDVASRYYQYTFAPEPGLESAQRLGARDLGVPERGRRPLRRPRAHVVSHPRDRGRVGRRGLAPALRRRPRGGVRLRRHRRRRARAHQEARPGGAGDVRRRGVPLGRVGPLGRAGGQADRRDRHRLDGDADHPRARAGRRPLQAVPAHAAMDLPAAQPPLHARRRAGCTAGSRRSTASRTAAGSGCSRRRSGGPSSSPGCDAR